MRFAADLGRQLVKAAMNAPYLEKPEEERLTRLWKDNHDEHALHQLIAAHMRLVIASAHKFRGYGLPMGDLVQEGHIGLLEAAKRFDPERDVRFSTYAMWWVKASMQDYILRNWSIVRGGTSSTQKALFFNLRRLRMRLLRSTDDLMSEEVYAQIAQAIGVSASDVMTMDVRLSRSDMSMNAPAVDDDGSGHAEKGDFIADATPLQDELVTESIDLERRTQWLRNALQVLNERELQILKERRLSEQGEGETLEALGHKMGISKERVRQIETRALEKLKSALLERHPHLAQAY